MPPHRLTPIARALRLVGAVPLALALSACGIESIPYFYPPNVSGVGGNIVTTPLAFSHNTSNTTNFRGYSLYYRCYDKLDNANTDLSKITTAAGQTNASPELVFSQIKSLGFKHIINRDQGDVPDPVLVVSNPSQSIEYQLNLDGNSTDWTLTTSNTSTSTTTSFDAVRVATDPTGAYLSFNGDYLTTDADYYGSVPVYSTDNTTPLFVVIFALAFGIDTSSSTFSPIPSLPASFNYSIEFQVPP